MHSRIASGPDAASRPVRRVAARPDRSTPLTETLRAERRRRGWSADAVAASLGVCQSTVSAWELGLRRPTAAHLAAWRALLVPAGAQP